MVQTLWSALDHWFVVIPPGGNDFKDALIAIASVAAVVWTGGLIAMQIKDNSIGLINGLDLLQTAFLGSALAIFAVGLPLRIVAILFFLYYLVSAIEGLRQAAHIARNTEPNDPVPLPTGDAYRAWALVSTENQYAGLTLLSLLFYIPVILWPSQKSVCIFGWGLTFLGMQMILLRLYGVDRDARQRIIPYTLAGIASGLLLFLMR